MHHKTCFKVTTIDGLTKQERRRAMEGLVFFSERRPVKLKAVLHTTVSLLDSG